MYKRQVFNPQTLNEYSFSLNNPYKNIVYDAVSLPSPSSYKAKTPPMAVVHPAITLEPEPWSLEIPLPKPAIEVHEETIKIRVPVIEPIPILDIEPIWKFERGKIKYKKITRWWPIYEERKKPPKRVWVPPQYTSKPVPSTERIEIYYKQPLTPYEMLDLSKHGLVFLASSGTSFEFLKAVFEKLIKPYIEKSGAYSEPTTGPASYALSGVIYFKDENGQLYALEMVREGYWKIVQEGGTERKLVGFIGRTEFVPYDIELGELKLVGWYIVDTGEYIYDVVGYKEVEFGVLRYGVSTPILSPTFDLMFKPWWQG